MSVALRNARLDAIETVAGASARIRVFTGSQPADCAAASSGTQLAEWSLASDWAANAASGSKSLSGVPLSSTASAAGTAGYYRILDSAGTTCHMQGSVTATGGGGDLTVDNTSIANGQTVQITGWTFNEGGA
jgi:hypothetical protein